MILKPAFPSEPAAQPAVSADRPRVADLAPTAADMLAQRCQLQCEVTRYIAMLLDELATMARAADLATVSATLEASRGIADGELQRHRAAR
jgi:hypothetical protein